jgi:transcriptional regulator GlxA family with amidase domain
MGMKPRSAEARFKEVCGHSIKDEIMSVRLALAKRLLSDTDLPISIICERCGYADERSLRYLFTKATGLSPADWRLREASSGSCKK